MITRVGYIGIGGIGGPIAANVVNGGFDLMVYDLRDEAVQALVSLGAKAGRSAREVAEHAEVVELSVTDEAQVEAAVLGKDGVLEGAKPGSIIAVHSTIHPRTVKKIAEAAGPKGVGVLDASPSGGADGAVAQRLVWFVGGDAELVEQCRPVFATSGKGIFHMGELGAGATAKCAQQIITTVNMLAAYEGFRVARAGGLDLESFSEALHLSAGQSYMADRWMNGFISGMRAQGREGFYKGLIPCLTLGHELGVSLPGAALIQQMFGEMPEPE